MEAAENVRLTLADLLEVAGRTFHEAMDAERALERLDKHPEIALVTTDVRMPGSSDGQALVSAIRQAKPNVPIIIIPGTRLRPEDLPLQNVSVMMKPISVASLVSAAKSLLPL
jgi:two-component system, response regulator PdtaR